MYEALIILFYFLPVIVAACKRRRNLLAIFAANLLLGWTGVGWAIILVWAISE